MDWWIYTIIGVVVIIVLIVALVLIIKSGKNKKNESVSAQQSVPVADQEDQDNVVEKQSVEEETAPVAEEQEPEVEIEEQDETAEEEEEEGEEVEVESTEKGKKTTKSYHVSLRKSDGMWQIKLAGGKKAIKLFRTQQEAIDYCKVLAEKQEANLTVHKKDGSFRKKNY